MGNNNKNKDNTSFLLAIVLCISFVVNFILIAVVGTNQSKQTDIVTSRITKIESEIKTVRDSLGKACLSKRDTTIIEVKLQNVPVIHVNR